MSSPPLDEQRIAAYVRGELGPDGRAEVEAALDRQPHWLAVVAVLARGEGATSVADAPRIAVGGVPASGTRVGRYVLGHPLGRGAGGVVLAAWDPQLRRSVALKLVDPSLLADPERARARLAREARALAQVEHRHVVRIYDVGTCRGRVFLAMERLDGGTLDAWRCAQPRAWREVVKRWLDAGSGLAAAHARGLVHRDFKPANVMLDDAGRVVVVDFGLARSVARDPTPSLTVDPAPAARGLGLGDALTRTGSAVGTPAYMPPEQRRGSEITAAADQYAYCVSLFEALTGRLPGGVERLPIPPLTDVPPRRLMRLLARGRAADPAQRYADMDALLAALASVVSPSRRWMRFVVGAAVVATGAWLLLRPESPCTKLASDVLPSDVVAQLRARPEPYADAAADRVQASIDRYNEAWTADRQEACTAFRARAIADAELDRRMRCLEGEHRRASQALASFDNPDATVLRNASTAAAHLLRPPKCDEPEVEDPRERQLLSEIRDRGLRLQTARLLGHYGGPADAAALVEHADASGLPSARARTRLHLGHAYEDIGELPHAARIYREGAELAMATGLADSAARLLIRAAWVVGHLQADVDEGRKLIEHAAAWSAREGVDPAVEADRLRTLGHIELTGGRVAAAAEAFAAAQVHAQAIVEGDIEREELRVIVLNDVGAVRLSAGDIEGAQDALAEAQRRQTAYVGAQHPSVASIGNNLAALARATGDLERSRTMFEANLETFVAAYGPRHPDVVTTHVNLAVVLLDLRDTEAALRHADDAVALSEALFGANEARVGKPLVMRGQALRQQERYEDALRDFRRAREILVVEFGDAHPEVGMLDSNIGTTLCDQGRFREAERAHDSALRILTKAWPEDDPRLAYVWVGLGDDREAQGDLAGAATAYRRAIEFDERVASEDARRALADLLSTDDSAP